MRKKSPINLLQGHTASVLFGSLNLFFSLIYAHTQEMEPQDSPLKIARFADFGIGLTNLGDSWNMESNRLSGGEGSPPIGLGLELGCGSGHRPTGFTKSCGFTVFQLQELQLQSLIYKYMEAGLPVPHHLLLPIWKSFAGSVGGLHGNPYQLYSGFLGCGPLHLEYKNGLDPEPGRCRRTDGKKWRCSKEAVPDHKYCERHMHRGRQRSRKLVEASQATTSSTGISRTNADTNLSISLQVDSSSSSGSHLSSSFIGFSPKSVLRGETLMVFVGLPGEKDEQHGLHHLI
ncbi:Growth-regulating factor 2 [Theobroma cacao]|uniref:Growth-regulating factor n=1 Tax=Theobroma cacao TaxID=3641 RepID=A0A061G555_THECC|nr:Growth-regulating factor 2 [Theobroma cacao]